MRYFDMLYIYYFVFTTCARVKIGYRCALKLLRCGARVIVTSRFPHDTAKRYAAENDYSTWKDRLDIYGLDFRDMVMLEAFCAFVKQTYDRLDVIINNACQVSNEVGGGLLGLFAFFLSIIMI